MVSAQDKEGCLVEAIQMDTHLPHGPQPGLSPPKHMLPYLQTGELPGTGMGGPALGLKGTLDAAAGPLQY